jgi:hypothetical protein
MGSENKCWNKFGPKFYEYYRSDKNLLVLVDGSFKVFKYKTHESNGRYAG